MEEKKVALYWFLVPWSILIILTLIYTYTHNLGDFVIWVNNRHSAFGDVFFKYASYLGNPITFLTCIGLLFVLKKPHSALQLLLVLFLTGTFVLLAKEYMFGENLRPSLYLADYPLQFVDGVHVIGYNAFPSGHTSDAFGLAFFLTYLVRNKYFSLLMLFLASMVAMARVYLGQHFLSDVGAGSVIGVMGVVIAVYLVDRFRSRKKSRSLAKK